MALLRLNKKNNKIAPFPPRTEEGLNPMYGGISSEIVARENENDTYQVFCEGTIIAVSSTKEEILSFIEECISTNNVDISKLRLMKKLQFNVGAYIVED